MLTNTASNLYIAPAKYRANMSQSTVMPRFCIHLTTTPVTAGLKQIAVDRSTIIRTPIFGYYANNITLSIEEKYQFAKKGTPLCVPKYCIKLYHLDNPFYLNRICPMLRYRLIETQRYHDPSFSLHTCYHSHKMHASKQDDHYLIITFSFLLIVLPISPL